LCIKLGFSEYPKADKGAFGQKVVLGTGYEEGIKFLSAEDKPVEVLQVTGMLLDREGNIIRSGAEGIVAKDTTWSSFNEGFETPSFAISVKQIGDTAYAAVDYWDGLQPSGVYKTSIKQANWKRSGDGFPAELRGVTSFVLTQRGAMLVGAALGGARGNVQVSLDRGQTWLNRRIAGVTGVMTLEANGDTIYAGTTHDIYVTRNNAASWQRLGSQFQNNVVDDILIFNRTLFAAVEVVGVVFSNAGGTTWNTITGNLPIDNEFISTLFIHGGKIFAALSAVRGLWSATLPATGIDENKKVPRVAALAQNYPNPFWSAATSRFAGNPSTAISFSLPKAEYVTLKVYNMLGKEVAAILNRERREAGSNTAVFTAPNLASGAYFYRLTAGSFTETKKMLLVR